MLQKNKYICLFTNWMMLIAGQGSVKPPCIWYLF